MKPILITAIIVTLALTLTGCGSSGDDPNDLIKLPEFANSTVENSNNETTSTDSGAALNPNLFNGRTTIDSGPIALQDEVEINYNSRRRQQLYSILDEESVVFCLATLTISSEDLGPDASYTTLIQAQESQGAETISIIDIAGPTNYVGIEYIYSFDSEGSNIISVVHAHYFSPQDVTFNKAAVITVECATFTNRYGQNEAQMRALLNSVEFLRGADGEPG